MVLRRGSDFYRAVVSCYDIGSKGGGVPWAPEKRAFRLQSCASLAVNLDSQKVDRVGVTCQPPSSVPVDRIRIGTGRFKVGYGITEDIRRVTFCTCQAPSSEVGRA